MYCPTCGTQIDNDEAAFCPSCGTGLSTAAQPKAQVVDRIDNRSYETLVQFADEAENSQSAMTYDQYVRFHQVRDTRSCLAEAEDQVAFLTKRFKRCCIVGAIVAFFIGVFYGSAAIGESTTYAGLVLAFAVGSAAMGFFIPFGFMPIIDFMHRNGFFVWGRFLLIALFAFVIIFACFAGLPYAIYLVYQIRKAKGQRDAIGENLSAIA